MDLIWKQSGIRPDDLNSLGEGTMGDFLGIRFTELGADFLKATMPVTEKSKQPFGLLHGGASAALAETIGSVASWLCIDPAGQQAVGLDIHCTHVRAKRNGLVTATVRPIHIGRTVHVWDIKIEDESKQTVCVSRLTVAVRAKAGLNK